MNLYEQYIKERENLSVIKTDSGFISYKIEFPNCLIADCFIVKEKRNAKHASFLANQVFEICKGAGVEVVHCQTDDRANGCEISKKSIESFGFELYHKEGPLSFYKMEVSKWEAL